MAADEIDLKQVGHDFWLTRNHHGSGFWDRDEKYPPGIADYLYNISKQFGQVDLYIGDDGFIYQ